MKTCLLLSLLFMALAVCIAEAVPVEAAAQEEASVPVEDLKTEETVDPEPAGPEAAEAARKSAVSPLSGAQPPTPAVQGVANTNCPHDWSQFQDACYLFVNLSYSWPNADAMCQSLGASLTSAHSLREYSFLKQLTWRAGFLTAWMGGYRFQGFWKWDDGSPFDYNNWYYLQSSSYDCTFLNSPESRGWSSERCNLLHPFICSTRFTHC